MGTRKEIIQFVLLMAVCLTIALASSSIAGDYAAHLKATNPEAAKALVVGILMGLGAGWAIAS